MNPATLPTILIVAVLGAVVTMAVLMSVTLREKKPALEGVNAISHIFFDKQALGQANFSAKYTLSALLLNFGAMLGWAAVAEASFVLLKLPPREFTTSAMVAIVVSVMAYVVDFHVVPKRLTPGFELVISKRSLLIIYVGLAVAFFIGAMLRS